jgi:hypothetical protein
VTKPTAHRFEPGVDVDMVAEGRSPDPRWCNVCGETRDVHDAALVAAVAEPTAAEIPREWVRAVERDERAVETLTDRLAGLDAWVRVTLAAALPLVEARLREQIAAEIEAAEVAGLEPGPGGLGPAARWGLGLAARIVRGD